MKKHKKKLLTILQQKRQKIFKNTAEYWQELRKFPDEATIISAMKSLGCSDDLINKTLKR